MFLFIVLIIIFLYVFYRHVDENYYTINSNIQSHKMPPLNIHKTLPQHQVFPSGFCGGIGNTCSADTDCCGGVYCVNNRCDQV